MDKYGPTAVLYSNLAAAHLKLEWYAEAERVATEALLLDPKMLKARYRRGLARKGARDYTGALEDFSAVLRQDPSLTEVHMHLTEAEYLYEKFGDEDYPSSDAEEPGWPYYEDDPISLSDSESDSSDCNHTGNNIPCRFYNHGGCSRKDTCNYSHAPDDKSERDKLSFLVAAMCVSFIYSAPANLEMQNVSIRTMLLSFPMDGGTIL
ncbi:hypothetical protein H0H93_016903, partial [Arthromyces matolae]